MRGKPRQRQRVLVQRRIIPAHAGQTGIHFDTPFQPPDHPRACGANTRLTSKEVPDAGSSPRMRGKLTVDYCLDFVLRIIPAHAGQTSRLP